MNPIYLKGVAIIASGIKNWDEAQLIFNGHKAFNARMVDSKLETLLSPNQNRRTSRTIQIALSAIQQLQNSYSFDSQNTHYVFSSCNGDLSTFHQISSALALPTRPVSPTKFHNSVHNAPAGYCAIALQSQTPSTSITAYEDSFAHGLLEATVQSLSAQCDCLLTGYDEISPEPLSSVFPIMDDFSCALLLSPYPENALCQLDIAITSAQNISTMKERQLEQLRNDNPQAKALPLLYCIACKQDATIVLSYNESQLKVTISGCNS